jgi:hypothetical protein
MPGFLKWIGRAKEVKELMSVEICTCDLHDGVSVSWLSSNLVKQCPICYQENIESCLKMELESARQELLKIRSQQTTTQGNEICPHRDLWTIINAEGKVVYKINACTCSGQTSPIA